MSEQTSSGQLRRRIESSLDKSQDYPFTEEAFREIQSSVTSYVRDLIVESARTAKRHQSAEAIESSDVRQASRYLTTGEGRSSRNAAGVIGGLLAGGALGNLLAVISTSGQVQPVGLAVSVVLLLVGAILITYQLTRRG